MKPSNSALELINNSPVLRRMFAANRGETRVVGTTPGPISDINRQKKMVYTYSSLR